MFWDEAGSSGAVLLELGGAEAAVEVEGDSGLASSLLLSTLLRPDTVDLEAATTAETLGRCIQVSKHYYQHTIYAISTQYLHICGQDTRRSLLRLAASREGGGGPGEGLVQEVALAGELLLLAARWEPDSTIDM